MSHPEPIKPASKTVGLKLLITASAITVTVAGWAALAATRPTQNGANSAITTEAPARNVAVSRPPLPTLISPPTTVINAAAAAGGVALANPGNANVVQAAPVLRAVQAPPPVTITRSSR